MIQSMIGNRNTADIFCLPHCDMLEENSLSVNGWDQLADAVRILQPFHSATLYMESDFAELQNILIELDFL